MRVNVDGEAIGDPRFKRLGRYLKIDWREALGRCFCLWLVAYERRTAIFSMEDVDIIAERDGFAKAMLRAELATAEPGNDALHLAGVDKRIEFLQRQTELGRAGGLAKARRVASEGQANATANAKRTLKRPSSLPLTLAPDLPPDPALAPDQTLIRERDVGIPAPPPSAAPRVKAKSAKMTAEEQATVAIVMQRLSERSGISYRGSEKHALLIVRLLRQGLTEWDLRRVIGYCAVSLQWETKPEMRKYLRPETLFGPQTIEKYLDAARTWEPGPPPQNESHELLEGGSKQTQPTLTLVDSRPDPYATRDAATDAEREEEPPWMMTS